MAATATTPRRKTRSTDSERRRCSLRWKRSTAGSRITAKNMAMRSHVTILRTSQTATIPNTTAPTAAIEAKMTRHGTGRLSVGGPAGCGVGGDGDGLAGDAGCGGGVGGVAAIGGQRTHGLTSSLAMGQPITVVEKRGPGPGVVRFELNRSLTGMGHERFCSAAEAIGDGPDAVLARKLFEHGGVEAVHVYSNVVT